MASMTVLGFLTVCLTLWDKFETPPYRMHRSIVFSSLGCVAFVPGMHYVGLYGWGSAFSVMHYHWTLLAGVLSLTGAALYALRVPEKLFPGQCDLFFHSHQIFHVLVAMGTLSHYRGLVNMAEHRLEV